MDGQKRTSPLDREMSLDEVAEVLGISRQRVQQIEATALRKLQRHKERYPEAWEFAKDD